ncbi:MAG: S-layer homology domain-containing protein, partial [Firmicutes bacterium]|nr:S-layer homology domain-containing protein [Bacillota bacterium]
IGLTRGGSTPINDYSLDEMLDVTDPANQVPVTLTTWPANSKYRLDFVVPKSDYELGDPIASDFYVRVSVGTETIDLTTTESEAGWLEDDTVNGNLIIHWYVWTYEVLTPVIANVTPPPTGTDAHAGKDLVISSTLQPGMTYDLTAAYMLEGASFLYGLNTQKAAEAGTYDFVMTVTMKDESHNRFTNSATVSFQGTDPGLTPSYALSANSRALTITYSNFVTMSDHSYPSNYSSDDTNHWKECTICGTSTTPEAHDLSWNHSDTEHWQVCSDCGYTTTSEAHAFTQGYNDTQHYDKCSGCAFETGYTAHTLSIHFDADNHWQECDDCDYATTHVAHAWDSGTVTTPPTYTAEGVKTYYCTEAGCNGEKTEPIAKLTPHVSGGHGGTDIDDSEVPLAGVDNYTWKDRGNLDGDDEEFYKALAGEGTETPVLEQDDTWVLATADPTPSVSYEVDTVMETIDKARVYTAGNGSEDLNEQNFSDDSFYAVVPGSGDKSINFGGLKAGERIRTTSFNGLYIGSVKKAANANYDADLSKARADAVAVYRAFELDHPEVFWLTGNVKLRMITTKDSNATSYLFLTLADNGGYSMRIPDYGKSGAIQSALQAREALATELLKEVPEGDIQTKVAAINRILTLRNEYNRSADLNSIGYLPHQCLAALTGNEGAKGPVCDGYSKAFKLLCDRLGIPCTLTTGVAIRSDGKTVYHMWNQVAVNGTWYGVDVAWNDPIYPNVYGAVSGKENEQYLLVGGETVVNGLRFDVSHKAESAPSGANGVFFSSLLINDAPEANYMPFTDVTLSDWYYPYVKAALEKNLMGGTSAVKFSPKGTASRGQIVQILYNLAGQPEVSETKVSGWYGKAATWAMEKGYMTGYPDGTFHGDDPVTREQLATILWAYAGAPAQEGTLTYADAAKVHDYAKAALLWAKEEGILSGKPGNKVDPLGTATRAEIAAVFSSFAK